MRRLRLLIPLLLVGCTQAVPIEDEVSQPPLPEASYLDAAGRGEAVYRILPQESLILVRVGRAGRMQRLGHEHAVASEDVYGLIEVRDDPAASRADLAFPIRNLIVDKPEYRQRLQLDTDPSPDDIAKTYTNMLKVFEPELFPWVEARVRMIVEEGAAPTLAVSISLHGSSREYLLPADLDISEDRLVVSGSAAINHSDHAVEPFSAAGGLVRVADELQVDYRFVAIRLPQP